MLPEEFRVGQLNLDQFLASTDLDNSLSTAGAATLEPPRDWVHEITLERRLGERDLLRLRAAARGARKAGARGERPPRQELTRRGFQGARAHG